jgi:CheY-like chemotaxis protein
VTTTGGDGEPKEDDVSSRLILIVDDNELDTKLVRDVLHYHGFVTLEAGTAAEAVALAIADHPDLILMDVRLPDGDGPDVVATLRADAHCATIPIVAVTANAMPGDEQMLLQAGFTSYLCKPIAVLDLPEHVNRLLEQSPERARHRPNHAPS